MAEHDDALDAFCRREHRRLVGALSLYCGDVAVAEEIAQEALYRACRQWSNVMTMTSPGAWVHRVAINLANSAYRRKRAEHRANRRHTPVQKAFSDSDLAAAVAVRQAVAELPQRQRAALVLRHYGGYTVAETAHLLGVSDGASGSSPTGRSRPCVFSFPTTRPFRRFRMTVDIDKLLEDAAAEPTRDVDPAALRTRARRARRRNRIVAGLGAVALVAVAGASVLAALGGPRVELAAPAAGAADPGWPLRLRADAVLSPPGGTGARVLIEMEGAGWDDWLAVIAHGPAETELGVSIATSDGRYVDGQDWTYTDVPFTLLDDAAGVVASAPRRDGLSRDFWGFWWEDTRAELVPHPVPHPLLRPWAATAAGMSDPPADKATERVVEREPPAAWAERRAQVADRLKIDPESLAVRSWETWPEGDCPSEQPSECRVTITTVLLETADVPLLVEVTGGGGYVGRLEVTHMDAPGGQPDAQRHPDGSDTAPVESSDLVGRDPAGTWPCSPSTSARGCWPLRPRSAWR